MKFENSWKNYLSENNTPHRLQPTPPIYLGNMITVHPKSDYPAKVSNELQAFLVIYWYGFGLSHTSR